MITEIPESSGSECSDDDSDYQPEKPSKNRTSRDIESESGEQESEPGEDNVGGAGEEIEDDGETREVIEGGVGKRKRGTWRIKDNVYDGHPLTFQGQNTVHVHGAH